MLVFSAICPHPPVIIPTIGKEGIVKVNKTVLAMEKLEHELYAAKPDVIVVISPHGQILSDSFTINLNKEFVVDFEKFGDWQTKLEFTSNPGLVSKFKERIEQALPIKLISEEKLDHGVGVPLFYLTEHMKNTPIIPISYSHLDLESHWKFGDLLREEIIKSDLRIAVIASGDLSHKLTKDAPAGFSPVAKEFDNDFIKILKKQAYNQFLSFDNEKLEEVSECGLRSFVILFGILNKFKHQVDVISYEGPLGVGYLVANFKLQ